MLGEALDGGLIILKLRFRTYLVFTHFFQKVSFLFAAEIPDLSHVGCSVDISDPTNTQA